MYSLHPKILVLNLSKYGCIKSCLQKECIWMAMKHIWELCIISLIGRRARVTRWYIHSSYTGGWGWIYNEQKKTGCSAQTQTGARLWWLKLGDHRKSPSPGQGPRTCLIENALDNQIHGGASSIKYYGVAVLRNAPYNEYAKGGEAFP